MIPAMMYATISSLEPLKGFCECPTNDEKHHANKQIEKIQHVRPPGTLLELRRILLP